MLKDSKLMAKNEIANDYDFWKKSVNILIKAEKDKLSEILDRRLNDRTPRVLNPDTLKDKAIISLFESSLTRALGIGQNELTQDLFILNVFFFRLRLVKFVLNERYLFERIDTMLYSKRLCVD